MECRVIIDRVVARLDGISTQSFQYSYTFHNNSIHTRRVLKCNNSFTNWSVRQCHTYYKFDFVQLSIDRSTWDIVGSYGAYKQIMKYAATIYNTLTWIY